MAQSSLWVEADGLGTGLRSSSVPSSADLALHELLAESDSLLLVTIGSGRLHFFVVAEAKQRSSVNNQSKNKLCSSKIK